jgi:hypothetical protein
VQQVAHEIGLPVDSPQLDDAEGHLHRLEKALQTQNTSAVVLDLRMINTDEKKLDSGEYKHFERESWRAVSSAELFVRIRGAASAALSQASASQSGSASVQNGATTHATGAPSAQGQGSGPQPTSPPTPPPVTTPVATTAPPQQSETTTTAPATTTTVPETTTTLATGGGGGIPTTTTTTTEPTTTTTTTGSTTTSQP